MKRIKFLLGKIKLYYIRTFNPNVKFGKNCFIDYNVKILHKKNNINIGDSVLLRGISEGYQASMSFPTTLLLDVKEAHLSIGNYCRINGAYIHAQKSIQIGNNCVIASGVNIMDSNGHEVYSSNRTVGRDKPSPIVIGDNVWIGLNSIILKGTVIGENSIIAAGSVVKGNFPNNSLIMGNPAVTIKTLDIK